MVNFGTITNESRETAVPRTPTLPNQHIHDNKTRKQKKDTQRLGGLSFHSHFLHVHLILPLSIRPSRLHANPKLVNGTLLLAAVHMLHATRRRASSGSGSLWRPILLIVGDTIGCGPLNEGSLPTIFWRSVFCLPQEGSVLRG